MTIGEKQEEETKMIIAKDSVEWDGMENNILKAFEMKS